MNSLSTYLADNEPRLLEELFSLIRIPSISAEPAHSRRYVTLRSTLARAFAGNWR